MVLDIGVLLSRAEAAGWFDFVLPFLLIFAVVYGILTTTKVLGSNKGVHVVISVVLGLLALRLSFVPLFFSEIFPRLGVGLAVILVLLIMIGLFVPANELKYWLWGLGAIAAITAIIIIFKSFETQGWLTSFGPYGDYVDTLIVVVAIVGLIIAVAASSGKKDDESKKPAILLPWRKDD